MTKMSTEETYGVSSGANKIISAKRRFVLSDFGLMGFAVLHLHAKDEDVSEHQHQE